MHREIKFRGKRTDNKEWIYGDLVQWKRLNLFAILPQDGSQWDSPSEYKVIPETIGQLTPYPAKNGKDIYEGDLIRKWLEDPMEEEGGFYWVAVIRFFKGCWVVCQTDFDYSDTDFDSYTKLYEDSENFEVIGNIHTQNSGCFSQSRPLSGQNSKLKTHNS